MEIFRYQNETLIKLQRPMVIKLLYENNHISFTYSIYMQMLNERDASIGTRLKQQDTNCFKWNYRDQSKNFVKLQVTMMEFIFFKKIKWLVLVSGGSL